MRFRVVKINETATGWVRGDTGVETTTLSEALESVRNECPTDVNTAIEVQPVTKIGKRIANILCR